MKIKLIRKIKQRIRDISNVWSVAGIRNVYVMAILPTLAVKVPVIYVENGNNRQSCIIFKQIIKISF